MVMTLPRRRLQISVAFRSSFCFSIRRLPTRNARNVARKIWPMSRLQHGENPGQRSDRNDVAKAHGCEREEAEIRQLGTAAQEVIDIRGNPQRMSSLEIRTRASSAPSCCKDRRMFHRSADKRRPRPESCPATRVRCAGHAMRIAIAVKLRSAV